MMLKIILLLPLIAAAFLFFSHFLGFKNISCLPKTSMLVVFLCCLGSPLWLPMPYTTHWHISITANSHLSIVFFYDALVWLMLCLVSFISMVIYSYAHRYLSSDINQNRFMGQLSLLTLSVMMLMMSGSLFTAFIAWQLIGLSLYLLLNHYHYNLKSNKAAKKKFMINRVGDICFLTAVLMSLNQYGSTEFTTLFTHAANFNVWILMLIFIAIMTKSAQFPFHIWLIDTMEAPTPVSALMHAGVINAGGFLLARLSPLYGHAAALLFGIFCVGFFTALLGNFFMQNQSDIKKKLAYSTVGQMGYMFMQCGLGYFASAVFHLVVHGFFKGALFLSSGSQLKQHNTHKQQHKKSSKITYAFSAVFTALLISLGIHYFHHHPLLMNLDPLLWFFIAICIFQLLHHALNHAQNGYLTGIFVALIVLIYCVYLVLLGVFDIGLIHSVDETTVPFVGWISVGILTTMALGGQWIYARLSVANRQHLLRKIYLWGFYKSSVEKTYRRYLINPMRHLGSALLNKYLKATQNHKNMLMLLIASIIVLSLSFSSTDWYRDLAALQPLCIMADLSVLILLLLVANRVNHLPRLFLVLTMIMVMLMCIAFASDKGKMDLIGNFQWINSSLVMLGCYVLLSKRAANTETQALIQNRLPFCHFYMSIFLMLLIGIPGSASFITEFYLFESLLSMHVLMALGLGVGIILLALVVLRALQMHFFNPKVIAQYAMPVSYPVHGLCWSIMLFNVFNGVYPTLLLRQLSMIIGT